MVTPLMNTSPSLVETPFWTRSMGLQGYKKCHAYLPNNYMFCWFQIWDLSFLGKKPALMWSIWHKAMGMNKWQAHIAPVSNSKRCIFAPMTLANMSCINYLNIQHLHTKF